MRTDITSGAAYLADAIVIASVVIATTFRYEFSAHGEIRSDRWTGKTKYECGDRGKFGWKSMAECDAINKYGNVNTRETILSPYRTYRYTL